MSTKAKPLSKTQAQALRRMFRAISWGGDQYTQYTRKWALWGDAFGIVEADKRYNWDIDKSIDCGSISTMRALVRKGMLTETVEERESFGQVWTSPRNPGRRFEADDARFERVNFEITEAGRAWIAQHGVDDF